MSIFSFIIAGILILLTLLGLISAIKNRDVSASFISIILLFIAFVPAYFGYMQMNLTGFVEDAIISNERVDEFGTIRCEFTVFVRNEKGEQDKIVWWGTKNDSRFAEASSAINLEVDNQSNDSKKFEYKRCEIQ
jgi:hypothetical protein